MYTHMCTTVIQIKQIKHYHGTMKLAKKKPKEQVIIFITCMELVQQEGCIFFLFCGLWIFWLNLRTRR